MSSHMAVYDITGGKGVAFAPKSASHKAYGLYQIHKAKQQSYESSIVGSGPEEVPKGSQPARRHQ